MQTSLFFVNYADFTCNRHKLFYLSTITKHQKGKRKHHKIVSYVDQEAAKNRKTYQVEMLPEASSRAVVTNN